MLREQSQPLYLEGYHRPDYRSPDDQVYDAIADLMSNGRTSRLYRALVRDKQIASDSAGFTGLPGNKYPHLFAFYAFPIPGHKPQEMADAIHAEIDEARDLIRKGEPQTGRQSDSGKEDDEALRRTFRHGDGWLLRSFRGPKNAGPRAVTADQDSQRNVVAHCKSIFRRG